MIPMDTRDPLLTPVAATVSRPERVFPTLTAQQLSRVAAHGRRRPTSRGEVLGLARTRRAQGRRYLNPTTCRIIPSLFVRT